MGTITLSHINHIILFCLLSFFSIAQNRFTVITGCVVCEKGSMDAGAPIKNAKVVLHTSAGTIQESVSDSTGKYFFKFNNSNVDTIYMRVNTDRTTKVPTTNIRNSVVFSGTRPIKMSINEEDTIRNIFYLKATYGCGRASSIRFYFNSVKMFRDSSEVEPEAVLSILYNTLIDNPNIIIEISGHSATNEKPGISKMRAEFIVEELVKKGINPKRLVAKDYGTKHLLIKGDVISKAKTKEEKEQLHAINQRISYSILNFDFKE